eukprot:766264-Hanusia_phi.AAC.3
MDGFDSNTKVVASFVKLSELQKTNSLNIEKRLASKEANRSLATELHHEGFDVQMAEQASSINGNEQPEELEEQQTPTYSSVSKMQFDARMESMRRDLANLRNLGQTIRSSFNARAAEVMHTLESSNRKGNEQDMKPEPPSHGDLVAMLMRRVKERAGGGRIQQPKKHIRLLLRPEEEPVPHRKKIIPLQRFDIGDVLLSMIVLPVSSGCSNSQSGGSGCCGSEFGDCEIFPFVARLLILLQENEKKHENANNHAER